MMVRMGKWFFGILLGLVLVLIVLWEGLLLSQKPSYSGEVVLPGIGSDVHVIRDRYGVPHIQANDSHSAFYALGYVTAQDRLFQMEMIRRLSQGKLAEIIGEDLVPIDQMFRSLRLGKWAREYANQSEHLEPMAWKNLDSYLLGVNAFISQGNLPVEYTLLGFQPEPFIREDALSSIAYMAFSFAEGLRADSLYSILSSKYPNSNIPDLFPRYDFEEGGSILNDQPGIPRVTKNFPGEEKDLHQRKTKPFQEFTPDFKEFSKESPLNSEEFTDESPLATERKQTANDLTHYISRLSPYLDEIPIFEGSNSWVLSGNRTETGAPILVNDPHIGYSNPGTWYEVHLKYPDMEVYGYFLPGVPYPLLGNTLDKAWGLTMLENDDMDLYYETISEDGNQVKFKNKWMDVTTWQEEIPVKGKNPESYTIRLTPHGTIFSDFIKGYEGRPISLYWVFHEVENPILDVLHGLLHAENMTKMRDYAGKIIAPGLNISYANKQGDIAWWGVGRFPIRKKITNQRKIMEGENGENEVVGFLPFSKNPQLENPKNGIIATANNLPSSQNYAGLGKLEGYWQPSDRFRRITEVLSKKERFNVDDMEKLLLDVQSYSAPKIWEVYIHNYNWESEFWKNQNPRIQDDAKEAMKILSNWNFETDLESRGATVYYVLTYFVFKNMVGDELGEELFPIYGTVADHLNSYKYIIEKKSHPIWDDVHTSDIRESRKDILNKSLVSAVEFLTTRVSSSPNLWQWKNLYSVEYVHAIGRKKPLNHIFNVGPFPTWGAPEVVNNVKSKLLFGDFHVKSGPSTRRIVSFESMDENRTIIPIGNSGNLASPFYDDQVDEYLTGKFRRTILSKEGIQNSKEYELILKNE